MYQSLSLEVKIYLNEEKDFRLGLGWGYKIITDLYENYTISLINLTYYDKFKFIIVLGKYKSYGMVKHSLYSLNFLIN